MLLASSPALGSTVRRANDQQVSVQLTFATKDPESLEVHALTDLTSPGKRFPVPLLLSNATENAATYAASLPCRYAGAFTLGFRYRASPAAGWAYVQSNGARSDIDVHVEPAWLRQSVIVSLAGGKALHDARFLLPDLAQRSITTVALGQAVPDLQAKDFIANAHQHGIRVLADASKLTHSLVAAWIAAGVDGFRGLATPALARFAHKHASQGFPLNGTLDGTTVVMPLPGPAPLFPQDIHDFLKDPFHHGFTPGDSKAGLVLAATLPGTAHLTHVHALDSFAQRLATLRKQHPALQSGAAVWVPNNQPLGSAQLASFARIHPDETLVVCVNTDASNALHPATITLPDALGLDLDKQYVLHDLLSGELYERQGSEVLIVLGPGQSHIFRVLQE